MTASYRFLLGPIPFLGTEVYEVQDIDAAGTMLSGAGANPAGAFADLESEVRQGRAPDDWRCTAAMAAALGLPASRVGLPDAMQRRAMLVSAVLRHPVFDLWPFQDEDMLEGTLAGLALLARRAPLLPVGRSFPYSLTIRGTRETELHATLSRSETAVSLALTVTEDSLRRLYEAAMGGTEEPSAVNLSAAVLDLPGDWLGGVMEAVFGVAFTPHLFQRIDGARSAVSDLSALTLGATAAACAAGTGQGGPGAAGAGDLSAGPETFRCQVEPLRL